MKYVIYAGLGGGFGGAEKIGTYNFKTLREAETYAYEQALEAYEGYEGLHGLRTLDDIMEQDKVDAGEAQEIYEDEREGWLDYYVKPVKMKSKKK